MRKLTTLFGAGALAASLIVGTTTAAANPQVDVYQAKTKSSMSVKASATSFVQGKSPVKLTATVKAGGKRAAGTVTFYDGKKKLKAVKLKAGKAAYTLPASLSVGTHKIRATYKPKSPKVRAVSKNTSVQVFSLSLVLDNTAYTVYLDNYVAIGYHAKFTGRVRWPWIDFWYGAYRPGTPAGDRMQDLEPSADGGFDVAGTYWWDASAAEKYANAPGVYPVQASFTPSSSAADAVAIADFTLTVLPNTLEVGTGIAPGNYALADQSPGSCHWVLEHPTDWFNSLRGGANAIVPVGAPYTKLTFSGCSGGPVPA
ncbi:MAG: Ig-like domain-containing protein [Bifidobacteriaceae bacterium]|jgi:hypothetical protein|nr:Ig-like domain-containing protein [Bifidobacteriaceae bacterium]